MVEDYHHLDQEILNGLLNGHSKALLLRDSAQPDSLAKDRFQDQQLIQACLEANLPVIDQEHPYFIQGCLLFFASEPIMAEFTSYIDKQPFQTRQNIWLVPDYQRLLGEFLGYPAGALYCALSYQELEEAELLVRYGLQRFRIGIAKAVDNIERLWLISPDEAKTTYLEYLQVGSKLKPKMYELRTHDHNGLDKVIAECQQYEEEEQKNVFYRFTDIWK